jgi:adenylyltransferase/sulfurtransferase
MPVEPEAEDLPSGKDIFDFSDYLKSQSCSDIGISSPICGLIGSYMANETIKIILSIGNTLEGKMLHFNTLTNQIRTINIKKQVATVT